MNNYNRLNEIKKYKSICLATHVNPDADALSSMAVMSNFLKAEFNIKKVDCFADFSTLQSKYNKIVKGINLNPSPKKYDVCIMLDAPNSSRLAKYQPIFDGAKLKIVIDHHKTNNYSGDINYVFMESSTCEILYNILKHYKYSLTKQDCENIYSAIVTDTNNFSVNTVSKNTFLTAASLYDFVDIEEVSATYMSRTIKSFKLLAKCIENVELFNNSNIVISHISKSYSKANELSSQEYDGIINQLATIENCKLICLIYPKDKNYYVSMRARDKKFDVSAIAKKYGGGGHAGAAAFASKLSIKNIKKIVLEEFFKQIKNR